MLLYFHEKLISVCVGASTVVPVFFECVVCVCKRERDQELARFLEIH